MRNIIQTEHNTYLATGVAGAVAAIYEAVENVLEVPVRGNPDFWHGVFGTFGIDESRELKAMSSMKPFGDRRVMIVETLSLTTEAQQAILKMAEELTDGSYFFLVVPTREQILPTLRSRFIHIHHGGTRVEPSDEAKTFLASDWKGREGVISEITKAKDQRRAYLLLDHIEHALVEKEQRSPIALVIEAKKRLLEGVIPMKMALETAAALIPQVR